MPVKVDCSSSNINLFLTEILDPIFALVFPFIVPDMTAMLSVPSLRMLVVTLACRWSCCISLEFSDGSCLVVGTITFAMDSLRPSNFSLLPSTLCFVVSCFGFAVQPCVKSALSKI